MTQLKVGDRIKRPTRKTHKSESLNAFLIDHKENEIFTIWSVNREHVRVASNGIDTHYEFAMKDLDPYVETEPKWKGLYVNINGNNKLKSLLTAFEEQIGFMNLGYNLRLGYGHVSHDNVIFLHDKKEYDGAELRSHYKAFDLTSEYSKALEFAKQFAKENKPKDIKITIAGREAIVKQVGIHIVNEGFISIERIKNLLGTIQVTNLGQILDRDVKIVQVQIGCTTVLVNDIQNVIDVHTNNFK